MEKRVVRWMLAAMVVCGGGCEPEPILPAEAEEEDPAVVEKAPATQPLDLSRTRTISLEFVPLTVTAPEAWKVEERAGGLRLLTGPTPSGNVRINIAERPEMTADQIGFLERGMAQEKAENRDVRLLELREQNGLKVFERQIAVAPAGEEAGSGPYRWTVTFFASAGKTYDVYELNFIGLTAGQFNADGGFLKKIIDSVRLRERGASADDAANP